MNDDAGPVVALGCLVLLVVLVGAFVLLYTGHL